MASIHNSTLSIKNLITDYANGRIGIPEFQRDLVWNDSKKVKLIDSIYNGFPIGTIMLWEPEELENIEYRKSRVTVKAIQWLIDGQQRTRTLYEIFKELTVPVYFNPLIGKFKIFKKNVPVEYIPIEDLLIDKYSVKKSFRDQYPDDEENIDRNVDNFSSIMEKEIPSILMQGQKPEQAVEIFTRINTTGVRLNKGDIDTAKLSLKHSKFVRNYVITTLDRLKKRGYHRIYSSHLFKACVAITKNDPREKLFSIYEIKDINRIQKSWKKLDDALNKMIEVLDHNLGIKDMEIMWSGAILMPIAVLIARLKPSKRDINKIIKWLLLSALKKRYSKSTLSVLTQDLNHCVCANPLDKLLKEIRDKKVTEKDFDSGMSEKSSLFCLFTLLKSRKAKDIFTKSIIGSKFDKHHIFPQAKMKQYSKSKVNNLANIVLIKEDTNKELSDDMPFYYLPKINRKILETQLIPLDKQLYSENKFELFSKTRRKMLAKEFNNLLRDLY